MVTKKQINEILTRSINLTIKCNITIGEMHSLLNSWSDKEKRNLIYYGVPFDKDNNFDIDNGQERLLEVYDSILEEGDEEEIFKFEKQIFTELNKTRRNNILKYLSNFDKEDYLMDDDVGYPTDVRGVLEWDMEQLQEKKGYNEEIIMACKDYWTNGFYDDIQKYFLDGKKAFLNDSKISKYPPSIRENIMKSAEALMKYIEDSDGLNVDTVLFRGGYWEIGLKAGDVRTIPCLNSTSYSEETARWIGTDEEYLPDNYMITVFAPKGTKGVMVNAPSLSHTFPEHEYLIGKNQKFIVLNVNDEQQTASILLLND